MRRILTSSLILLTLLGLAIALIANLSPEAEAATELPPANASAAQPRAGIADRGGQKDTFVPTEKLPADSAISFPVDI